MSLLLRFKEIMSSSVRSMLERSGDAEEELANYLRGLRADLNQVKAETAKTLADESRAKRALDACTAEARKLQRYVVKTAEAGRMEESLSFQAMLERETEREAGLRQAWEKAAEAASSLKAMENKLASDLAELEARAAVARGKLAAAEASGKLAEDAASAGHGDSVLERLEEKAERAYDEAEALVELRGRRGPNIDELFESRERPHGGANSSQGKADDEQ
ncbi:PspA/IM30 family protein [Paenibacillus sp. PL2-23]|uniref:PspA/IM30 family protein n=1 Tax=Paenibacillus sp. PL2-23 TaxID=2100729 RepID=UPI0030F87DB5